MQFPHFSPLDRGFPCDPFSNIKPQNVYDFLFTAIGKGMGQNTQAHSHPAEPLEQAEVICPARCLSQGETLQHYLNQTVFIHAKSPNSWQCTDVDRVLWFNTYSMLMVGWWCYTSVVIEASKLLKQRKNLKPRIWNMFPLDFQRDELSKKSLREFEMSDIL